MARQTLDRNKKYKLLLLRARPLGLTKPQVRGLLETMWDVCHECGDTSFPSAEHVEAAAEWWGDSGAFVAIISADGTNFVDRMQDGSYEVHDYWDHCPDYVKSRLRQERLRKETAGKFQTVPNNLEKFDPPTPTPTPNKNKYIPPAATALAASCPLDDFPKLQKLYPGIREHLLRAHPKAKLPKTESRQGIAERETLARLIRIDNYTEGEVLHTLRWVLKATSEQADFWRSNFRAIGQLRKVKDGGTKFTKIFDAMQRDPDWPEIPRDAVPPQDVQQLTLPADSTTREAA